MTGQPLPTVWTTYLMGYPDQAGVEGYYASATAAVAGLKARFPVPPYIVEWSEERDRDNTPCGVIGRFEAVLNYSTEHSAEWMIEEHEMEGAPAPPTAPSSWPAVS